MISHVCNQAGYHKSFIDAIQNISKGGIKAFYNGFGATLSREVTIIHSSFSYSPYILTTTKIILYLTSFYRSRILLYSFHSMSILK